MSLELKKSFILKTSIVELATHNSHASEVIVRGNTNISGLYMLH